MSIYTRKPSTPPPSGEKMPLDVVFATSLDGRLFELPTDVADKYEVTAERARELGGAPIVPDTGIDEDDEVGGRHKMLLPDGTQRYHTSWAVGAYVWHRDYRSYSGPHWHPDPNSPLAHDGKDY